jgi:ABC-type lipoprotein export system ATPase subunit
MIELVKAGKIYTRKEEEPVTALSDISLSLPSAGLIFILGKSGSGKTTLLNLLGGLDSLSSGEMLFEGKPPPRI